MRLTQLIFAVALFAATAFPATANEYADAIKMHADSVKGWLSEDVIQSTLEAQNAKNAGEHTRSLIVLDRKWKKQLEKESKPIISEVMGNDLSAFLRKKKEESQGLYAEIVVIDERGLSAGQSDVTEDYWYGREDVWKETYRRGTKSMYISETEKDESGGQLQSRLGLPVPHPSGNYNVGAISIRLNVEKLPK